MRAVFQGIEQVTWHGTHTADTLCKRKEFPSTTNVARLFAVQRTVVPGNAQVITLTSRITARRPGSV